jgi:hypothetical protein
MTGKIQYLGDSNETHLVATLEIHQTPPVDASLLFSSLTVSDEVRML